MMAVPWIPRPRMLAVGVLAIAALVPAAPAAAKPVVLDRTFGGGDGIMDDALDSPSALPPIMDQSPDGTIALAQSSNGASPVETVALVTPDGRSVRAKVQLPGFRIEDVAFQSDGKLLVSGSSGDRFAVARVTRAGTLDPAYAGDGIYESVTGDASEIAVEPSGSAIVVGSRIERIGPSGSLQAFQTDDAREVALGPDGAILAVSGADIIRLTPALAPDPGFAPDIGDLHRIQDVEVQADGRILVANRPDDPGGHLPQLPSVILDRLLANGGRDTAFTRLTNAPWPHVVPEDLAIDPSGRIVIAGSFFSRPDPEESRVPDALLARTLPSGALDRTFATRDTPASSRNATDVVLQGDGKILVSHGVYGSTRLAVSRYFPQTRCGGRRATHLGSRAGETIQGTNGRDVIVALGGSDRLLGLRGDDVICGGKGRDRLLGGRGRDRLFGGKGADILRGGRGRDLQSQ